MIISLYRDIPQDISDFGDAHGLTLNAVDRGEGWIPDYERFKAWFGSCACELYRDTAIGIVKRMTLAGHGSTLEIAIEHYCRNISGIELTHFAPGAEARTLVVPNLRHFRHAGTDGGPVIQEG